jgi:transposase
LATVLSQFQKRALGREQRKALSEDERKILRKLQVSLSEIATARRVFDDLQTETLARRARALSGFGASSPNRGFANTSWS